MNIVRVLAFLCMVAHAAAQPLMYRPSQEHRSLSTDSYTLSIQKNGRIDVVLSNRLELFSNVRPMVWLEGEGTPREMRIRGKHSFRQEVNTVLGRGQGMVLESNDGQWVIDTYPDKPFFVAQIVFRNATKSPVRVRSLHPWHVDPDVKGSIDLGGGGEQVRVLAPWSSNEHTSVGSDAAGSWVIAATGLATQNSLVAGFLAHDDARGEFRLQHAGAAGESRGAFHAAYRFAAPVELAPGESIASGPLYLAVAETNILEGLERFAAAVARATGGGAAWLPQARDLPSVTPDTPDGARRIDTAGVELIRDANDAARSYVNAARRYFVAPSLGVPRTPSFAPRNGSSLAHSERQSLLTAFALLGAAIQIPDNSDLNASFLRAISDTPARPARPIDLFQDASPRLLALPLQAPLNDVTVLGVFNWDRLTPELSVPLASLGLVPGEYYVLYDIWKDEILGTARDTVTVAVQPGSMALFALRIMPARPALLGLAHSITMGAARVDGLTWESQRRVLEGNVSASDVPVGVRVLVPATFEARSATIDATPAPFSMHDRVLHLEIASGAKARRWRIEF